MNTKSYRTDLPRDEAHARELIADWRGSQLPLKTFCRDHGLSYASLYVWKRKLDRRLPTLFEVKLSPPAAPAARAVYEVVLAGGRVVRVADDFHDDTLARLVAVVDRAC